MADVELIHVSRPHGMYPNVTLIPMGLPALADYLERGGFSSSITHVELEKALNPSFEPASFLAGTNAILFGLDLHWHYQARRVGELVRRLKRASPGTRVVLGGYTASFFDGEILGEWPGVDFVIRGDAEKPLAALAGSIRDGLPLSMVPNLTWRDASGRVRRNPHSYTADAAMLDSLCHSRFETIRHHREYLRLHLNAPEFPGFGESGTFFYNCGMGCPFSCSFCGGGRRAQSLVCRRRGHVFTGYNAVLRQFRRLPDYGVGWWYTCFDPEPAGSYYVDLFERMRALGLSLGATFESWGLPSPGFLKGFARAFRTGSRIAVSPETGSERVRMANKGFFYTNGQLWNALQEMEDLGIQADIYFTAGLPFETGRDVGQTAELVRKIRVRFPGASVAVFQLDMEPASPMHLDGRKFGVRSRRRAFMDFVRAGTGRASPGYSTNGIAEKAMAKAVESLRAAARISSARSSTPWCRRTRRDIG